MISEHQRNPTFLSRLKESYNQPGLASGKIQLDPTMVPPTAQTLQNESLSKLLNQTDINNLTVEQKQQLKIAFAEGYLAASHPENAQKGSRAMKYLKVRTAQLYLKIQRQHFIFYPLRFSNSF